MALWLAMLHACGARAIETDVRWMRLAPDALARHLAALGHVLYLPGAWADRSVRSTETTLLAAAPLLEAVLKGDRLCLSSAVTAEGPREWLTVVDSSGRAHAQLHLLPDTDYLAWDALLAAATPCLAPRGRRGSIFRAAGAYRLSFGIQRVALFELLVAHDGCSTCELSEGLARRIARNEGVRLAQA